MNSAAKSSRVLRITLRELFLGLAFVGVSCAALKYAGDGWWVLLSTAAMLGFLAAVVVATVGRGSSQARAIGCVVCVSIYAVLVWSARVDSRTLQSFELNPRVGRLPTTKLLGQVYESFAVRTLIDADTGQPVPADYMSRRMTAIMGEVPNSRQFMAIGHVLWAVAIGYLGSRFAGWVYSRREAREERSSPS